LVVADAFGPGAGSLRGMSIGIGTRVTGWVASQHQVIVNSDAALDLGVLAARVEPPLVSCLAVPLSSGQAVTGVLTLYSPQRDGFDENQGRLLQMIVPHVAQAIAFALAQPVSEPSSARDLRLVARR
jgi:GAF domain-containing protein